MLVSLLEHSFKIYGFKTQVSWRIFISSAECVTAAEHPIINEVNCVILSKSLSCFSSQLRESNSKTCLCFPAKLYCYLGRHCIQKSQIWTNDVAINNTLASLCCAEISLNCPQTLRLIYHLSIYIFIFFFNLKILGNFKDTVRDPESISK